MLNSLIIWTQCMPPDSWTYAAPFVMAAPFFVVYWAGIIHMEWEADT